MLPETREMDRKILGNFLRWGFGSEREALKTKENPDGNKNLPWNMAFNRLHSLGIIEKVPESKDLYRIPPHLVREVGKFVGKPKK